MAMFKSVGKVVTTVSLDCKYISHCLEVHTLATWHIKSSSVMNTRLWLKLKWLSHQRAILNCSTL